MDIIRQGTGPWPEVSVTGTTVTLTVGDNGLDFNCAELQRDEQVAVDIVSGHDGEMTVGTDNGIAYIANLIIPPARYADVPLPATLAEEPELPEDLDPLCIALAPTVQRERLPLTEEDMAAVRLIIWTLTETNNQ